MGASLTLSLSRSSSAELRMPSSAATCRMTPSAMASVSRTAEAAESCPDPVFMPATLVRKVRSGMTLVVLAEGVNSCLLWLCMASAKMVCAPRWRHSLVVREEVLSSTCTTAKSRYMACLPSAWPFFRMRLRGISVRNWAHNGEMRNNDLVWCFTHN